MTDAQAGALDSGKIRAVIQSFAAELAYAGSGFSGTVTYGATTATFRLASRDAVLIITISTANVVTDVKVEVGGVPKTLSDPTLDAALKTLGNKILVA